MTQSLQPSNSACRNHKMAAWFSNGSIHRFIVLPLFIAAWLTMPDVKQAIAQRRQPAPIQWHTGSALRRALNSEIGFTWQNKPLREGLQKLAEAQRVAIFLDRRIDPNQTVTISIDQTPMEDALRKLAGQVQLGVGRVGPVLYVGPPITCARIATLAQVRKEQVRELPEATHQRVLKPSKLSWPNLTEPRLLIARAATSVGFTIPNIQAIPHDLWAAGDLPEMTFPEQATLLLAGFDNSFRYGKSGRKILLARFPRIVTIERRYRSDDPQALFEKYQKEYPQAFVELDEETSEVVVKSLIEDHEKIAVSGNSNVVAPKNPAGEKRHSLTVKNQPAGKLIKALAVRLSIELEVDPAVAVERLEKRVSISVKEVSSEELLQKIAEQAGLRLEFTGNTGQLFNK